MTTLRVSALAGTALIFSGITLQASAAISLDRTRIIFNGAANSLSVRVTNENKTLPYLAQAWVEDPQGNKITQPLVLLPPVQRIEPGEQSQIKVQSTPAISRLPQDRESLFYFNLREIPPKSSKPNTLQLALQTRIKLFYRPQALELKQTDYSVPFQQQLTLAREGDKYRITNPTPYYISLVNASSSLNGSAAPGFSATMVEPKGQLLLAPAASALGTTPVLTYVNDYGGRAKLVFSCSGNSCKSVAHNKDQ